MRRSPLDIHCHGAVGSGFGDDLEGSRRAAEYHRRQGVQVVASLVSATDDRTLAQVRTLAPLVADGTLAGIHLEGPFLAASCRGAHDPAVLRDPDPRLIEAVASALSAAGAGGGLRHVTFAPELDGSDALIEALAAHGVVPALGHTAASAGQVRAAISRVHDVCGRPPIITHLFNGMPAFHHRSGGAVAAALSAGARGEAFVELIADGVHVAADVVRMVFDTVDPAHIVLVSDATAATGRGDGTYPLGSSQVQVRGGTARLVAEHGSVGPLAGSAATLADCVAWAVDVAGVARSDAERAAVSNPRRALGLA